MQAGPIHVHCAMHEHVRTMNLAPLSLSMDEVDLSQVGLQDD